MGGPEREAHPLVVTGGDAGPAADRHARQTVVRCRVCFGPMGNLADHPQLGQLQPADRVCAGCRPPAPTAPAPPETPNSEVAA